MNSVIQNTSGMTTSGYGNQRKVFVDNNNILQCVYEDSDNHISTSQIMPNACWTTAVPISNISYVNPSLDFSESDNEARVIFVRQSGSDSTIQTISGVTQSWSVPQILVGCDGDSIPDVNVNIVGYSAAYKYNGKINVCHNISGLTHVRVVSDNTGKITANNPVIVNNDSDLYCIWNESDGSLKYNKAIFNDNVKQYNWQSVSSVTTTSIFSYLSGAIDGQGNVNVLAAGLSIIEKGVDTYNEWNAHEGPTTSIENVDIVSEPGYAKLTGGQASGYIINKIALDFVPITPGEFSGEKGWFFTGENSTSNGFPTAIYDTTDGTTITAITNRLILSSSDITRDADMVRVRVKSTATDGLSVMNLSLGERDGSTYNVDGNLTYLTFSGQTNVILPANTQTWSDWTAFNLDSSKDHLMTYYAFGGLRDSTNTGVMGGRYYPNEPTNGYNYSKFPKWSKETSVNGIFTVDYQDIPSIGVGATFSYMLSNSDQDPGLTWTSILNNGSLPYGYKYIKSQIGLQSSLVGPTITSIQINYNDPDTPTFALLDSTEKFDKGSYIYNTISTIDLLKINYPWGDHYIGNYLPRQCGWILNYYGEPENLSTSNGILTMSGVADPHGYIKGWASKASVPTSQSCHRCKVKLISGCFIFGTCDRSYSGNPSEHRGLWIYPTYICFQHGGSGPEYWYYYYMDTTDAFHTYEFRQIGSVETSVFVDGNLVLTGVQIWWSTSAFQMGIYGTSEAQVSYYKLVNGASVGGDGLYETKWLDVSKIHSTDFASDDKWQVVDAMDIRIPTQISYGLKYNTVDNYATADPVGDSNWYPVYPGVQIEPYRYTWVRLNFNDSTPEKVDYYKFDYYKGYNKLYWNKIITQSDALINGTIPLVTLPEIASTSIACGDTQSYIMSTVGNGDIYMMENRDGLTSTGSWLTANGNNNWVSLSKDIRNGKLKYLYTNGSQNMSNLYRLLIGETVVEDKVAIDAPVLRGG